MKRAHEIKKQDSKNIWSLCLKMAWAEAKAPESIEERLLSAGYKIWDKKGKRIYINNFKKYLNFVENTNSLNAYCYIVNGIDISNKNRATRKKALALLDTDIKLYFDCESNKFVWNERFGNDEVIDMLIRSAIQRIKEEV